MSPHRLRDGLEAALYWSGAGALVRAALAPSGAVVLMYHSVPDARVRAFVDPSNAMSAERFDRQMRFLARHRNVLGMSELNDRLDRGESPPAGSVVITFDDGYRDTLDTAAEILARYDLPATVYLATGYVTRGETQWVDRLHTLFECRTRDAFVQDDGERIALRGAADVGAAKRRLGARLITSTWEEREALLARLEGELAPASAPPRLTLDWDEVRTLARRFPRFEIGVHTRDHLDLVAHPDRAESELRACVADAEAELDAAVRHFSYPYGRANAAIRDGVERAGFRSAAVTEPAERIGPQTDRFALPRLEAPASMTLFAFRTSGVYPELPRGLLAKLRRHGAGLERAGGAQA